MSHNHIFTGELHPTLGLREAFNRLGQKEKFTAVSYDTKLEFDSTGTISMLPTYFWFSNTKDSGQVQQAVEAFRDTPLPSSFGDRLNAWPRQIGYWNRSKTADSEFAMVKSEDLAKINKVVNELSHKYGGLTTERPKLSQLLDRAGRSAESYDSGD